MREASTLLTPAGSARDNGASEEVEREEAEEEEAASAALSSVTSFFS